MSAKVREYFWQWKMAKAYIFLSFQCSFNEQYRSFNEHQCSRREPFRSSREPFRSRREQYRSLNGHKDTI